LNRFIKKYIRILLKLFFCSEKGNGIRTLNTTNLKVITKIIVCQDGKSELKKPEIIIISGF
jgi:hypothetical protein